MALTMAELSGLGQTLFQYSDPESGIPVNIVGASRGSYYGYLKDDQGNVYKVSPRFLDRAAEALSRQPRERYTDPRAGWQYGGPEGGERFESSLMHEYRRGRAEGTVPRGMSQGQYQAWAREKARRQAAVQARAEARGRSRRDSSGNPLESMTAAEAREHDRRAAWERQETRRVRARRRSQERWEKSGAGRRGVPSPEEYTEGTYRKEGYRQRQEARWAASKARRKKQQEESKALARKSRDERRKAYEERAKARREANKAKVDAAREKMKKGSEKQLQDLANNPNAPGWQRRLAQQVLSRRAYTGKSRPKPSDPSSRSTHEGRGPSRAIPAITRYRPKRTAFATSAGVTSVAMPGGGRRVTTGGGRTYGGSGDPLLDLQRKTRAAFDARVGSGGPLATSSGGFFMPGGTSGLGALASSEASILSGLG
jgi:hypothetical protein